MFSAENTSPELAAGKPSIALVPVGAVEQHAAHLPLITDALIAQELSRRVAEKLDAYLLPVLPVSNSQEHMHFAGTVWIQPHTLAQVITDLCTALDYQGIRKIAVLSFHGGNWIIKPTVRRINLDNPRLSVITAPVEAAGCPLWDEPGQIHACRNETSLLLHLRPDLVKGTTPDFIPTVPQTYLDYVGVKGVSPTGVWGSPSKASAELGRRLLEQTADGLARYIHSTFDFIAKNKPAP